MVGHAARRGQPPAKVLDWEGTPLVLETVREGLEDPDAPVRLAAVNAVREIGDRDALATLRGRFASSPIPTSAERPRGPSARWATGTRCRC